MKFALKNIDGYYKGKGDGWHVSDLTKSLEEAMVYRMMVSWGVIKIDPEPPWDGYWDMVLLEGKS